MSDEDVFSTAILLFQKLSQDDQDSVRLLTVEVLVALAKRLDEEKRRELLLPAFTDLSNDKAWRVRYMVASKYVEVTIDKQDKLFI
jgi:serine/threonine-protein phosphatase 2A regulatory subunit A